MPCSLRAATSRVSPPATVRVATVGSSPSRCSFFCSSASARAERRVRYLDQVLAPGRRTTAPAEDVRNPNRMTARPPLLTGAMHAHGYVTVALAQLTILNDHRQDAKRAQPQRDSEQRQDRPNHQFTSGSAGFPRSSRRRAARASPRLDERNSGPAQTPEQDLTGPQKAGSASSSSCCPAPDGRGGFAVALPCRPTRAGGSQEPPPSLRGRWVGGLSATRDAKRRDSAIAFGVPSQPVAGDVGRRRWSYGRCRRLHPHQKGFAMSKPMFFFTGVYERSRRPSRTTTPSSDCTTTRTSGPMTRRC